jgi:hypothetical protein
MTGIAKMCNGNLTDVGYKDQEDLTICTLDQSEGILPA